MTVGYIHSGKTTFGKQLAQILPRIICLERDPISAMLNDHFPALLLEDKKNWNEIGYEKIKDKVYNLILQEIKRNHKLNMILTNCHTQKEFRGKTINQFRLEITNAKIIMVYFDIDMKEIENRVRNSVKPTNVLTYSTNFMESLERQKKIFDVPTADEADYFFTVRNNTNTNDVMEKISDIVNEPINSPDSNG